MPELHGSIAVKITVHHTGGKRRGSLCAPDNAVEFLPGIAKVIPVKVDDGEFTVAVDHHITNMIVAVLIALRPALQQMTILSKILKKCIATVRTSTLSFHT